MTAPDIGLTSQARAFTGLSSLPAAFRCDLATDELTWAAGIYDIFGIQRGARVDRREIVELYTEESRELLEQLRSDAIAACGSFTFEAQVRRLDGELRWMRVTADVVSRNGRADYLYGVKQDVTDEVARTGDF